MCTQTGHWVISCWYFLLAASRTKQTWAQTIKKIFSIELLYRSLPWMNSPMTVFELQIYGEFSVTKWLDYSINFLPLHHWIVAQQHKKLTKVGQDFCQTLIIFCQGVNISPNLVTLLVMETTDSPSEPQPPSFLPILEHWLRQELWKETGNGFLT